MNCQFKGQYTKSKYKPILRHLWKEKKEIANDYRYQDYVKGIYKHLSTHIDRLYADGKMKHGLLQTKRKSQLKTNSPLCTHES